MEEEIKNAPCQCPVPKNGYPKCAVCHIRMCPQREASFCDVCYFRHKDTPTVDGITFVIRKDQYGRIIDPIKNFSMRTCICGLLAIGFTNCKVHWYKPDSGHRMIMPKKNMG